jgi:hypothetical protein
MEMTNYFNNSELVALNSQEMSTIEGGGWVGHAVAFVAGMISELFK